MKIGFKSAILAGVLSLTLSSCAVFKQYEEPTGSNTATILITPEFPVAGLKVELSPRPGDNNYKLGYIRLAKFYDNPKAAMNADMPPSIITKVSTDPNQYYFLRASFKEERSTPAYRVVTYYSGSKTIQDLKPNGKYVALITQGTPKTSLIINYKEVSPELFEKYKQRVMAIQKIDI